MITLVRSIQKVITPKHLFMISVLIVNGGNYIYNLVLGRILGPQKFADVAILITLLLIVSFVAMTFQLVTSKFSVLFEKEEFQSFISKVYKQAIYIGCLLGFFVVVFSKSLQLFFNTSSSNMFVIFGIGIPFYFLMSVNRGIFQGKDELAKLSVTYQTEMISRLLITLILLQFLNLTSSLIIAIGIFCSFLLGLIPFKTKAFLPFKKHTPLTVDKQEIVRNFFIITAFYELTQIIINNSDILLVKHYFDAHNAGLYASLALIGRVVYFIAWMFVMLLLPTLVRLQKEGKPTKGILIKYVFYISTIASIIIASCYFLPEQIVLVLFGDAYIAIAPLLWKYALATGLFAVSNIFAYYYLSLSNYIPVIISGVFGLLQIVLIVLFHDSLQQVVYMQIITMLLLLCLQLLFFLKEKL